MNKKTAYYVLAKDELKEILSAFGRGLVTDLKKELAKPEPKEQFFTRKEAAAFLNISISALHKQMQLGKIPFEKIGRSTRFRISDLAKKTI